MTNTDLFNRSLRWWEMVVIAGGVLTASVLVALIVIQNDGRLPTTVEILIFLAAYAVGVFFHELGHAVAARVAGGTVDYIVLGSRYPKEKEVQFQFLGFLWRITSLPFSGAVHSYYESMKFYRTHMCWVIACGPLVNVLFLLLGIALLGDRGSGPLSDWLIAWCLANALILLYAVPPLRSVANDGYLFWQIIHFSDQQIRDQIRAVKETRVFHEEAKKVTGLSLAELQARHKAEPLNRAILWELMVREEGTAKLTYLLQLIELPGLTDKQMAPLIDMYLTNQIEQGSLVQKDRADALSLRLLAIENTSSTRGTRASVLVDLGRLEEGKTMLQEVLKSTRSDYDKVFAHVFLALVAQRQNDLSQAKEHARAAQKIDASLPVLKRVSDLLA